MRILCGAKVRVLKQYSSFSTTATVPMVKTKEEVIYEDKTN
jgi:hypothetical protein